MTPYFRKTSALADVGWGGTDTIPRPDGSGGGSKTSWAERKTIPLKLCFLCRNLSVPDPQRRTIELYSPDGKHSCVLRCPDESIANQWFSALHSNIYMLTQQAISELMVVFSNVPSNSTEIKQIGWLAEQVSRPRELLAPHGV